MLGVSENEKEEILEATKMHKSDAHSLPRWDVRTM
jgi:hypothetical protein